MPSEREEAKACVERWQASRKGPQDLVLVLACVVLSKNPSYKATFHRNKEGGCHLTIDLPSSTVAPMRDEIPWSDSKEKRVRFLFSFFFCCCWLLLVVVQKKKKKN